MLHRLHRHTAELDPLDRPPRLALSLDETHLGKAGRRERRDERALFERPADAAGYRLPEYCQRC